MQRSVGASVSILPLPPKFKRDLWLRSVLDVVYSLQLVSHTLLVRYTVQRKRFVMLLLAMVLLLAQDTELSPRP